MLKKYHESEVEWNKIRLRALFIAIRVSCAAIYSSWTIKTQSDNISAILVVQSSSQFNYLLRNKTAIPSNIFWFHFEMCFCAHQIFSGENIGRISLSLCNIFVSCFDCSLSVVCLRWIIPMNIQHQVQSKFVDYFIRVDVSQLPTISFALKCFECARPARTHRTQSLFNE